MDFKHSLDPDFIITLANNDITEYVQSWELLDDEEGMSTLSVQLSNPDMRNSGLASEWDWLAIRFGYQGDMSGQAGFYVMEITEHYPTSGDLYVSLRAYDQSASQAGDKHKGNLDTNNTKTACEKTIEMSGGKASVQGKGVEFKDPSMKCNMMNENAHEAQRKFYHLQKPSGAGGGSNNPNSPKIERKQSSSSKGPNATGYSRSGTGLHNETNSDDNEIDKNRMGNDINQNQGEPVTGSLELVGYPWLKAKGCIDVLNVGDKASGTYYVKSVRHKWDPSSGYRTHASLIRSGYGKGGAGQAEPIVYYADIYKKDSIYIGPRKIYSSPQDQFTYGVGGPLISFEMSTKIQSQRGGGGGGGVAETHDLRDAGKAKKEKNGSDSSEFPDVTT